MKIDPKLDLVLERHVDVPTELVWAAWTKAEHLKKWFCPKPWRVTDCEIDLRPGGIFRTTMEGPNGERFEHPGCYLEVVPQRRLTFTDALEAGFRPIRTLSPLGFRFTAHVLFEPAFGGTKYTAIALHAEEADARKHDEIGFTAGWGKALDQLVEAIEGGAIR
jgi:uncharacterized protein YndB with AHSA1/START domain